MPTATRNRRSPASASRTPVASDQRYHLTRVLQRQPFGAKPRPLRGRVGVQLRRTPGASSQRWCRSRPQPSPPYRGVASAAAKLHPPAKPRGPLPWTLAVSFRDCGYDEAALAVGARSQRSRDANIPGEAAWSTHVDLGSFLQKLRVRRDHNGGWSAEPASAAERYPPAKPAAERYPRRSRRYS
jgi:hypothetical protein